MTEPARRRAASGAALGQLATVVLLFGCAWPVIKIGLVGGASPLWFAAARAALGAAVSFALLLALGRLRLPGRGDLPIVLSVGALQLAGFFALANLGVGYLPAGRASVLAYTTSLWLVPLAAISGESIAPRRVAGVALGVAGILVLIDPWSLKIDRDTLLGESFLLLAALGWALAIFHARRHAWRLSPLQVLPWQMLLAAAILALIALRWEPAGRLPPSPSVLFALTYLGVLAGPVASWAAMSVARALPTLVTSVGFLGVPVLGVTLSTLWLGESLTPDLLAGAALILGGLVLVATEGRA